MLGLIVIERAEVQQSGVIATVVVVTVTLSLVLHSLAAWPGVRLLSRVSAAAP